jgi:hypothetical protein
MEQTDPEERALDMLPTCHADHRRRGRGLKSWEQQTGGRSSLGDSATIFFNHWDITCMHLREGSLPKARNMLGWRQCRFDGNNEILQNYTHTYIYICIILDLNHQICGFHPMTGILLVLTIAVI